MSGSERIVRSEEGGVCTLTLNRPDKLNALDTESFEALERHLVRLEEETDRIGCVVLRGAGKGFCAGADLNALGKSQDGAPVSPHYKPGIIQRLQRLPQPLIVGIHGVCYTGGMELALAGDFIIADSSARFSDTHGKWGLVAAWGLNQRLQRRVGQSIAKRLMMTGVTLDANEANDIGLVDLLAGEEGLDSAVNNLSADILANSWHTNFSIKRLMRETDGMSLSQALAYEHLHYPGNAPDHTERVERFRKK